MKLCKRLVASPDDVMEKKWARKVIDEYFSDEGMLEKAGQLSYHGFLAVMLGRKRFKVHLWLYDISSGLADRFSSPLLGQKLKGLWHTGVVVEWPDALSEYWFGGKVNESRAGSTRFGKPVEKMFLGYTYKTKREFAIYITQDLASEFTRESYDVLTHNCNHLSDKLCMYLLNQHIPTEILNQPEMIMQTTAARVLRPLLNMWLGACDSQASTSASAAQQSGPKAFRVELLRPGALVEFLSEGGQLSVGRVCYTRNKLCLLTRLDLRDGHPVEHDIAFTQIQQVLKPGILHDDRDLFGALSGTPRNQVCCGWLPDFWFPAATLQSAGARSESRRVVPEYPTLIKKRHTLGKCTNLGVARMKSTVEEEVVSDLHI